MKASEVNFLKFLQGTKQFIVPIYQRKYSWGIKHCKQLWEDIIRVANNDRIPSHFVGSIVYIEHGLYQVSAVSKLLIIDGQQRLTTLSLLLLAFSELLEKHPEIKFTTKQKMQNYYLYNSEETDELKYKLLLTNSDKDTYISLINGAPLQHNYSPRLKENLDYFRTNLDNLDIEIEKLYQGITKLIVVDIALDKVHDNPQLIFESLNSTGLDLSQSDLIRNYVLMGLEMDHQRRLYYDYWHKMELDFGQEDYAKRFDWFIRVYLTVKSKSGKIPTIYTIYEDYKKYVHSNQDVGIDNIISDLHYYSGFYVKIVLEKETDPDILAALVDINILRIDVSYPLLLELYTDYDKGILNKTDFVTILRIVESYVYRRAICGIPTNSLNKTFATLTRSVDKDKYLESILANLIIKDYYRRFPNNEEFIREFKYKDVYNYRNTKYLLNKLENYNRRELVNVDDFTIEHILPQNPNPRPEWVEALGENWKTIQEKYIHTIGNLTLTGYNSQLSDRPFIDKRDMEGGFADSPIRLNRSLAGLNTWNQEEIEKRAELISTIAVQVWDYPTIEPEILDQYRQPQTRENGSIYSVENYPELDGEMFELYELLRKKILELSPNVREEFKKYYIAYKLRSNFVDIVPQNSRLRISLNMKFPDINDPEQLYVDVTDLGHWGNGDIEFGIIDSSQIEYVMFLIKQSFDMQNE